MRQDFYYPSKGAGQIHGCRWAPEGEPKAVVQIVHGIAEHVLRYDQFANYLNSLDILVVAEDHMGHGGSVGETDTRGCFTGGWMTAAEDTWQLLQDTRREFPGLPYVLFGHSMGSFMARTILCTHPDSGIGAAVICGTGWQPAFALPGLIKAVEQVCKKGEKSPSPGLEKLMFGAYNRRVEHPRTKNDWLTRDAKIVDGYLADPMCGFTPTAGLVRDLLTGILYIETPENLAKMNKDLPVFFIAGGDDPVGSYGKGVRKTAEAFRKAGMTDISVRIYPLDRHEILNELNKEEVFEDVAAWMQEKIKNYALSF